MDSREIREPVADEQRPEPVVIKTLKHTQEKIRLRPRQDLVIKKLSRDGQSDCVPVKMEYVRIEAGQLVKKTYTFLPDPDRPLREFRIRGAVIPGEIKFSKYDPAQEEAKRALLKRRFLVKILYCSCGHVVGAEQVPESPMEMKMQEALEAKGFRAGSELVKCPSCAKTLKFEQQIIETNAINALPQDYKELKKLFV